MPAYHKFNCNHNHAIYLTVDRTNGQKCLATGVVVPKRKYLRNELNTSVNSSTT